MNPTYPPRARGPAVAGVDVPAPRAGLDMARLEDLTARDGFAVYDPATPGGFRELTGAERALLTPTSGLDEAHEHLAASQQRADAARAHLAGERDRADRAGDPDQAAIAREGLRVLDEETARDLRNDPRIPSRAELDELYARGEATGWDEMSARAWEYADARRDIADQRAAALDAGDTDTVTRLDERHAQLDHNYLGTPHHQPDPATERPGPAEPGRALTETEQALRDAEHTAHLSELAHDGDPGPARDAAALHALHGLRPDPQPETHTETETETQTDAETHADPETYAEVEVDDEMEH